MSQDHCPECRQPRNESTRHEFVGHWPDDVYHHSRYCGPRVRAQLATAIAALQAMEDYATDTGECPTCNNSEAACLAANECIGAHCRRALAQIKAGQ